MMVRYLHCFSLKPSVFGHFVFFYWSLKFFFSILSGILNRIFETNSYSSYNDFFQDVALFEWDLIGYCHGSWETHHGGLLAAGSDWLVGAAVSGEWVPSTKCQELEEEAWVVAAGSRFCALYNPRVILAMKSDIIH